jgi:hypothetical protein
MLSKEQFEEYKRIYKEEFGEEKQDSDLFCMEWNREIRRRSINWIREQKKQTR